MGPLVEKTNLSYPFRWFEEKLPGKVFVKADLVPRPTINQYVPLAQPSLTRLVGAAPTQRKLPLFPEFNLKSIRLEPAIKALLPFVADGYVYGTVDYRSQPDPYPVKSPLPGTKIEYKLPKGFAAIDLRFSNSEVDHLRISFNPPIQLDMEIPILGPFINPDAKKIREIILTTKEYTGHAPRIEDPNDPFYVSRDEAHSKRGRLYVVMEDGTKQEITRMMMHLLRPKGSPDQKFPLKVAELFDEVFSLAFTARRNKLAGKPTNVKGVPLDFEKLRIVKGEFSVKPAPIHIGPLVVEIDPTVRGKNNRFIIEESTPTNIRLTPPYIRRAVLKSKAGKPTFIAQGISSEGLLIKEKELFGARIFSVIGKRGSIQSLTMDLARAYNTSKNFRWSHSLIDWNAKTGEFIAKLGNIENSRVQGSIPEAEMTFDVENFSAEEAFGPPPKNDLEDEAMREAFEKDAAMRTVFEERAPFEANEATIERKIEGGRETYSIAVVGAHIKAKSFSATTESAALKLNPTQLKASLQIDTSRPLNSSQPFNVDPRASTFSATIGSPRFNIGGGSFNLPDASGARGYYIKVSPDSSSYVEDFALVLLKEADKLISTAGNLHLKVDEIGVRFGKQSNLPLEADLLLRDAVIHGPLKRLEVTEIFKKHPLDRQLLATGDLHLISERGGGTVASLVPPYRFQFKSDRIRTSTYLRLLSIRRGVNQIVTGPTQLTFFDLAGDASALDVFSTKLKAPQVTVNFSLFDLNFRLIHRRNRNGLPFPIGVLEKFNVGFSGYSSGSWVQLGEKGRRLTLSSQFGIHLDQTNNRGVIVYDPSDGTTSLKFYIGPKQFKVELNTLGSTEVIPESPPP